MNQPKIKTTKIFVKQSIQYWHLLMTQKNNHEELKKKLLHSLKLEIPNIISLVMERTCNLNCRHCCFQTEKTSQKYSQKNNLDVIIYNLVKQMPSAQDSPHFERPCLIHTGRTLKLWHLDILSKVKKIKPDLELGLIDNGSFTNLFESTVCNQRNFPIKFDFIDISIEGPKKIHNLQRDPAGQKAFTTAVNGLKQAKKMLTKDGRLSALMTLTSLNYNHIEETVKFLFSKKYVDELHITTMNPALPKNFQIEISVEQLKIALEQIKKVCQQYKRRIFFKIYNYQDLSKLIEIIGEKKFRQIFINKIFFSTGVITFNLNGLNIMYYPSSMWPLESFLIDADACNRTAYSHSYTLCQLRNNSNFKKYTVTQLTGEENYKQACQKQTMYWWKYFGQEFLDKEQMLFKNIRADHI